MSVFVPFIFPVSFLVPEIIVLIVFRVIFFLCVRIKVAACRYDSAVGADTEAESAACCHRADIAPAFHIALTFVGCARGDDSTVLSETEHMPASRSDGGDTAPARYRFLFLIQMSCQDDGSVLFQSRGIHFPCIYCDDICPAGYPESRISFRQQENRSVFFQPEGKCAACGDGGNICPVLRIALAILIVARRDDGPVFFQSDGVVCAGGDIDDIAPAGNILIETVISAEPYSAVFREYCRVFPACRDSRIYAGTGTVIKKAEIISRDDGSVCFQADDMVSACGDLFYIMPVNDVIRERVTPLKSLFQIVVILIFTRPVICRDPSLS